MDFFGGFGNIVDINLDEDVVVYVDFNKCCTQLEIKLYCRILGISEMLRKSLYKCADDIRSNSLQRP